jgi:pimeloyl-[acyl-carrier protein] methyl ester esterase
MSSPTQTHVMAAHGWAGDSRAWRPWAEQALARTWSFSAAERSYGKLPAHQPTWPDKAEQRVVIGHSLGPHLLPKALWQEATCVVLLASFAAFVPEGREGRSLRAALRAMEQRLNAGETTEMLRDFFRQAAAPYPPSALPPGPLEQGIDGPGLERLQQDLVQLGQTSGLPQNFPQAARLLIVEAADDQIVHPSSRAALRSTLPDAEVWTLERAGHCLLNADLPAQVLTWIADGPR